MLVTDNKHFAVCLLLYTSQVRRRPAKLMFAMEVIYCAGISVLPKEHFEAA